jgi:DNA replication protein DnaC
MSTMSRLKLHGMMRTWQAMVESRQQHDLTHDQLLDTLVQSEWEYRENKRFDRHLRQARFRYGASIEEIDFASPRGLDKTRMLRLADAGFIERRENLLITGPTGVGKSFFASALGHQACLRGYRTLYFNTQKLFAKLKILKADGTYLKEMNRIERCDLLILDDFGMQNLDNTNRMNLMEIIEDRHGRKSTLIASQLPVASWYEVIGESTIADAILDRLIHGAHRIELKGSSMRKKEKQ